jgi:hypothetical protein
MEKSIEQAAASRLVHAILPFYSRKLGVVHVHQETIPSLAARPKMLRLGVAAQEGLHVLRLVQRTAIANCAHRRFD